MNASSEVLEAAFLTPRSYECEPSGIADKVLAPGGHSLEFPA
jgi:hypothetical protein